MEIHSRYRGKPIKMAKCGKYSYSHCTKYWDTCKECVSCTLIHRVPRKLYIWIGLTKYKLCSKCKQYYPIKTGYYKNSNRNTPPAWCKYCHAKLQKELKQKCKELL